MAAEVLSPRALNRATLARQLLLERSPLDVVDATQQLVSLQAQFAKPVHAGLWTRLAHLAPGHVTALAADRQLVRATMMRHTLHVLSARDYRAFRRTVQPGIARAFEAMAGKRVAGVDRDRLLNAARERFAQSPATFAQIRGLIATLEPDVDVSALGYLVRSHLELVQVPSGTGWSWPGTPQYVLAPALLGDEVDPKPDPAGLLRRYLAAFGPASVRDMQTWSGLTALRPVIQGMRDRLLVFADASGRELFDLPGAPRPGPEVDAPPRLLPEFDNLVVAHQDRTRLMSDEHRRRVSLPGARVLATFLVDGTLAGSWRIDLKTKVATVTLTPFVRLGSADRAALTSEALGMAAFLEPAARDVAVVFAPG